MLSVRPVHCDSAAHFADCFFDGDRSRCLGIDSSPRLHPPMRKDKNQEGESKHADGEKNLN
jgi:hypothetical protein